VSRPVRALWIEMMEGGRKRNLNTSRPVRALWIEIEQNKERIKEYIVEAREGLVD